MSIKMKKNKVTESQTPVDRKYEDWMTSHWRPLMAYTYMAIVVFDFILGPIMFTIFAVYTSSSLITWTALTLEGGGLFHLSMGAILGAAAWSRGSEKIERVRRYGNFDDKIDDNPFNNNQ
jgi:hypothetical protein